MLQLNLSFGNLSSETIICPYSQSRNIYSLFSTKLFTTESCHQMQSGD